MRQEQYIKTLQKKQGQTTNAWLRLARISGSIGGYLRGGRVVSQGVGVHINDNAVVLAATKAHISEIMASRSANKINRTLRRLRAR